MDDDRIERLLSGYRLPEVSRELDDRVLSRAVTVMEHARIRAEAEDLGRSLLDRLGFGYVTWLIDALTTTDAEYGVEFF